MESSPQVTTSFLIIQGIDGSVSVSVDSPILGVREATVSDIEMLSRYVADSVKKQAAQPTAAQNIQARLEERLRNGEQE